MQKSLYEKITELNLNDIQRLKAEIETSLKADNVS